MKIPASLHKKMSSNLLVPNVGVKNAPIAEPIVLDLESDGKVDQAEKVVNDVQVEANQKVA